jgi:hypothetical protein
MNHKKKNVDLISCCNSKILQTLYIKTMYIFHYSKLAGIIDPSTYVEFLIEKKKNYKSVKDLPMKIRVKFSSILFSAFREEDWKSE